MPPYTPKDTLALLVQIPAMPVRRGDLTRLYARLKVLLDHSARTRSLSALKYAVYIILLINLGSLPFVWHFRVFWPVLVTRLNYLALRLKLVFVSKKERTRVLNAWAENLSPVGSNPFQFTTVYRRWASVDDIDMFGLHLSNSSYAKALDSARAKALIKYFPTWGRSGGKMPLGANHFHFLREIPPLARYEVRLTIGSWDHKWLYVVARYVTRPNRRHATRHTPPPTPDGLPPSLNGSANVEHAVTAISNTLDNGSASTRRAPTVEADGTILHCLAVSQVCFKWGRITVPPAVVLASEGFTRPYDGSDSGHESVDGMSAGTGALSYSHNNPPPNWVQSQLLRVPPHGSMETFRAFLRGKWRDVPEGKRWWEDALGGSIEAKRQANLEILESLKLGLERVRERD